MSAKKGTVTGMKNKLLFALQLANIILIIFMLGVQIAEFVSTIIGEKRSGYIKI